MDLITPQPQTNRTINIGDVIQFDGGRACIVLRDLEGKTHIAWFDDNTISIAIEDYYADIETMCGDRAYTVYSAAEWSLRLVHKQSQPCSEADVSAPCKCGEKVIVHNGVCLDCALSTPNGGVTR